MNNYIQPTTEVIKVLMPAIMGESNNGSGGLYTNPEGEDPAPARNLYV